MKSVPRVANIIRWIARIWSILVFLTSILIIFIPTEKSVTASNANPIAMEDAFLLSLYGVTILGLLLAWWKEASARSSTSPEPPFSRLHSGRSRIFGIGRRSCRCFS